jgi:hypothetical protein
MPDNCDPLADPRVSGRSLFALKRIAEALRDGWLTVDEAKTAAERISPHCSGIFDGLAKGSAKRAAQIVAVIERILEMRFPTRFRATASGPQINNNGDRT